MTTVKLHEVRTSALPFELQPRHSFTTACPECADTRHKTGTRSLSVYRDEDGMIRYKCHHPGCVLNAWSKRPDPSPQDIDRAAEVKQSMPIPPDIEIPTDYMGDHLYWYRDIEGRYLFANRRINISNSSKIYVPFIYTEDGFVTGKGARWPSPFNGLYGLQTVQGKTKAVIVEGEKAADAAQKRFPNCAVVSWLGGANRGIDDADWSVLRSMTSILLWPDNDEAGRKAMRKLANLLPCDRILMANVTHLAPGADLADDISEEDFRKAIGSAHEMSTKLAGVFSLQDIETQISAIGTPRNSGYEVFDSHTQLPRSGLVVIEGRTKHGKSALAVAITAAMLRSGSETSITFYSYEMTAAKVFMRYLKTLDTAATIENYKDSAALPTVSEWVESGSLKIIDQGAQLSIGEIVQAISKPQVRGGIVVIDYLQIVPIRGAGMKSRQLMLKEMLDELRVVAHQNNVLVAVLSQLTPDYNDPRNDSPREAKDIHYSADLVLRVWNKSVGEANPGYDNVPGNYIVHTYLNRDGESNVKFEGQLEAGSKLTIKRRIRDK